MLPFIASASILVVPVIKAWSAIEGNGRIRSALLLLAFTGRPNAARSRWA